MSGEDRLIVSIDPTIPDGMGYIRQDGIGGGLFEDETGADREFLNGLSPAGKAAVMGKLFAIDPAGDGDAVVTGHVDESGVTYFDPKPEFKRSWAELSAAARSAGVQAEVRLPIQLPTLDMFAKLGEAIRETTAVLINLRAPLPAQVRGFPKVECRKIDRYVGRCRHTRAEHRRQQASRTALLRARRRALRRNGAHVRKYGLPPKRQARFRHAELVADRLRSGQIHIQPR